MSSLNFHDVVLCGPTNDLIYRSRCIKVPPEVLPEKTNPLVTPNPSSPLSPPASAPPNPNLNEYNDTSHTVNDSLMINSSIESSSVSSPPTKKAKTGKEEKKVRSTRPCDSEQWLPDLLTSSREQQAIPPPDPSRCAFYHKSKNRYCKGRPIGDSVFCGNHRPNNGIPCPACGTPIIPSKSGEDAKSLQS